MKTKKEKISLDHKVLRGDLPYKTDEGGNVTLLKENKGVMNKVFQKLLKKPEITQIHLDEMGSFIWLLLDGDKDITSIGEKVSEHFGDKAEPLYDRLIKYIEILRSYGFCEIKK